MSQSPSPDARRAPVATEAESTFELLDHAREGDDRALDILFARYLKPLQRWAAGRLPRWARGTADTHDIVQDTLLNAFRKIGTFEPRREGAFLAYLRQAVMNRIRDEIRRSNARPAMTTLDEHNDAHGGSAGRDALAMETFERYETALARLETSEREAVIGRLEFGHSYEALATILVKPSADAARMAVARALVKLAKEMTDEAV